MLYMHDHAMNRQEIYPHQLLVEFPQVILPIVQNKTFTSKNLQMRDIGLSTFKQLIGGLLEDWSNKHPIENISSCTYCISL